MEKPNGIITLTTDFHDEDGFVGAMKGVMLRCFPQARMVDIAHHLPRQDVVSAALVLGRACLEFPPGTVHLVVIDPGVGSGRAGIIVETQDYLFVLPDNGLMTFVSQHQPILRTHRLENPAYQMNPLSRSFHGRDLFAPAAAFAASGADVASFGAAQAYPLLLHWPVPKEDGKRVAGEIMSFDVYGNALTNLPNQLIESRAWRLSFGGTSLFGPSAYYAENQVGEPMFLQGSMGFVEIAVREGDARKRFSLSRGIPVVLERLGDSDPS